jgi:hypothetical protein
MFHFQKIIAKQQIRERYLVTPSLMKSMQVSIKRGDTGLLYDDIMGKLK